MRSELMASFDSPTLTELARTARPLALRRNDSLFGEGDAGDHLYVVVHGRIAIVKRAPDGRESVVALMEDGDLFGEMALFDSQGRSAEARALEASEVLAMPYPPIRKALEDHPLILWNVVTLLAGRLRAADDALADSMFLDVPGRTAKRLLEQAGEADEFSLKVTQEQLAGLVGASRERVNKAIATFARLGWLEQEDRRYRILDRAQLVRRAR